MFFNHKEMIHCAILGIPKKMKIAISIALDTEILIRYVTSD